MVITLTNLPAEIEEALQRKAAEEGKSVDRVTLDVLTRGLELGNSTIPSQTHTTDDEQEDFAERAKAVAKQANEALSAVTSNGLGNSSLEEQQRKATLQPGTKRDLSFLVGTWVEDPAFDAALEEQRQIDPELWQ